MTACLALLLIFVEVEEVVLRELEGDGKKSVQVVKDLGVERLYRHALL